MLVNIATITIEGFSPYTQSRFHEEPKLKGELAEDYDIRTCLNRTHVNDRGQIIIPQQAFTQCVTSAARYSKKQIPGQGKATWTAKFQSGLAVMEDIVTNVHKNDVRPITIFANADGVRGSGKRVMRRLPQILPPWSTTFAVHVLDPIITPEIFREIVGLAGTFIGIGQFRPEKGGHNGRFKISNMTWEDNREFEPYR